MISVAEMYGAYQHHCQEDFFKIATYVAESEDPIATWIQIAKKTLGLPGKPGMAKTLAEFPEIKNLPIKKGFHQLISYAVEHRDERIWRHIENISDKTIIDSGAFSFHSGGAVRKTGTLRSYAQFIEDTLVKFPDKQIEFINLDVIGDFKKTKENWIKLKSLGVPVVPVWAFDDSRDNFEYYVDQGANRISVGGMASFGKGQAGEEALSWSHPKAIELIQNIRRAHPDVSLHILGCSSLRFLKSVLVGSVDSVGFCYLATHQRTRHTVFYPPEILKSCMILSKQDVPSEVFWNESVVHEYRKLLPDFTIEEFFQTKNWHRETLARGILDGQMKRHLTQYWDYKMNRGLFS